MLKVPIIVRLQGTNAAIAKELIDNSGMPILSAVEFQEGLTKLSSTFLIINIVISKNPE
jgi:succinyl-CoA synthetase beta subunit